MLCGLYVAAKLNLEVGRHKRKGTMHSIQIAVKEIFGNFWIRHLVGVDSDVDFDVFTVQIESRIGCMLH